MEKNGCWKDDEKVVSPGLGGGKLVVGVCDLVGEDRWRDKDDMSGMSRAK